LFIETIRFIHHQAMQHRFIFPFILVVMMLISVKSSGQGFESVDVLNATPGKWSVCKESKLLANFQCEAPFKVYEFDGQGMFTETMGTSTWKGRYEFSETHITIKRTDGPMTSTEIEWLDKNRFYTTTLNVSDSRAFYTYYQRVAVP
jgi:hypothetical protein